jgi:phage head maturation protease
VTFPAYESTEINARGKEALESARQAVETARQQRAKSVDTDLELLKAKIRILGGI